IATPTTFRPLTVAAFALWTPAIRFFGPDPLAGQFPPLLAFASVLSLINLVATLLDRTARDPDERLRRIGLGLLAVATVATVVERHLAVESLVIAPDDVMALVVVSVLPLLAFALPAAPAQFGMNPDLVTHYEDATVVRSLNYPALNFLLVTPFIALGVTDIRWIYLVEIIALVLILLRKVHIPWRPLVSAGVV